MPRLRKRRLTASINEEWPTGPVSWDRLMFKLRAHVEPQGGQFMAPEVGIGLVIHTNQLLDGRYIPKALGRIMWRLKKHGLVAWESDFYVIHARIYSTVIAIDPKIIVTIESEGEENN